MPDEKPIYEYELTVRDAAGNVGHTSLEGRAGGARNAQEAAAEGSMILQEYLKLKPIARDR